MNKQQFDRLYSSKAIQCDTEKKANDFLALAKSVGYQWATGADLEIKNYWDRFRENTIYHIDIWGPFVYYTGTRFINADIHTIIKYGEGSTLEKLAKEVHENAKEHGWWDEPKRSFGELIALCHSELSEALEEHRNQLSYTDIYYTKDKEGNDKPEGIPTELADVVIRIMDMCEYYGIDLEKAIVEKNEYNKKRPYKHGGKRI